MDTIIILAAIALGALIVGGYLFWQRYTPSKMHLGPYVHGKSKTIGTKLKGKAFAFPNPTREAGHVHALVVPAKEITGKAIRLEYRIDGRTAFRPQEHPTATGQITLMVQRKGDNWSGKGEYANYRVFYTKPLDIVEGQHVILAPLEPELWSGVFGYPTPDEFSKTLDNAKFIHICFGGGSSAAHGVYAEGPARFTLISLEVV